MGSTRAAGPARTGRSVPAAAPAAPRRSADGQSPRSFGIAKLIAIVLAVVVGVALIGVVALFVLRNTSVFEITSIAFEPTEHVSAEDVQSLAALPEGATLLNVDTDALEEQLKKDPWVASASFSREFPGTLRVTIEEQVPEALVLMSSQTVAWYLSEAGTWIEPVLIETSGDESSSDAALEIAAAQGCFLVIDVPSTVDPAAGSAATDEVLEAVMTFQDTFSEEFASQIACYSAPSAENVSCVLDSGVEVSLGSATDISEKEEIVTSYLEQNEGALVRINVRVPSSPAYREISSSNVQAGDGVVSSE